MRSWYPPFAKNAKDGAPTVLVSDFVLIYECLRFWMSRVMPLGSSDADRLAASQRRPVRPASSAVLSLPLNCFRWLCQTGAPRPVPDRRRQPCVPRQLHHPDWRLPTPKNPLCALLVSTYGPSVMRTLPSGCARSDLVLPAGEAANENPDTGSHHLIVEHVDIAGHRFVLCGRVVVVGKINSNQILSYFICRIRSCRNCRSGSCWVSARAFS